MDVFLVNEQFCDPSNIGMLCPDGRVFILKAENRDEARMAAGFWPDPPGSVRRWEEVECEPGPEDRRHSRGY